MSVPDDQRTITGHALRGDDDFERWLHLVDLVDSAARFAGVLSGGRYVSERTLFITGRTYLRLAAAARRLPGLGEADPLTRFWDDLAIELLGSHERCSCGCPSPLRRRAA